LRVGSEELDFLVVPRSSRHKESGIALADFETLRKPKSYLNGSVLNALVNLVDLATADVAARVPKLQPIAVFNTWFATKIYHDGYGAISTWPQTRVRHSSEIYHQLEEILNPHHAVSGG
jgi:Ulp1 family protease